MPPEDLVRALQSKPFKGLRIHVSDGTKYEVRHPELVMVGFGSAVIGMTEKCTLLPLYNRFEVVALSHIVRLEPFDAPTPSSN